MSDTIPSMDTKSSNDALLQIKAGITPTTPQSCLAQSKKSLLTPCRRLGLRKMSPNTYQVSKHNPVAGIKDNLQQSPQHSDTLISYCGSSNIHTVDEHKESDNKCVSKMRVTGKEKFRTFNTVLKMNTLEASEENLQNDLENNMSISSKICNDIQISVQTEHVIEVLQKDNTNLLKDIESNTKKCKSSPVNIKFDVMKELDSRIKNKEHRVEQLKLAQLYKRKLQNTWDYAVAAECLEHILDLDRHTKQLHDLNQLEVLTGRWRKGCQEALYELLDLSLSQGYQLNMVQLLANMGIPHDLVAYNQEKEDFQ